MKATDPSHEASSTTESVEAQGLADLRSRILASLGEADPRGLLTALVAIDPVAALDWLLTRANGPEGSEAPGPDMPPDAQEIPPALSRCFDALAGRPESAEILGLAAKHFADLLSPGDALRGARALYATGRDDDAQALLEQAIERTPDHAALLRERADRAVRALDVEAHNWLTRLARADRGAATALHVYRSRAKLPKPSMRSLRVALLSSFTIDSIVPYVDLDLRDLELVPELHVAPFDTWEREVRDPQSELRRFDPEIAFLAVSIDDLAPDLAGPLDAELLSRVGQEALDRVLDAARQFSSWSNAPLVVHGFHSIHRGPLGILEGRAGPARTRWLADLNAQLADGLAELPRAYLLDMSEVLARRTDGPLDHPKLRHMAAMRLSEGVSAEVARAYARYVAPLVGRTRKVVVLDLDNTLWGGVVGEDGVHGIKLAAHGPGSEFQEFQRYLLGLTEQGILLAINSKNNPDDAWEVIRGHEDMILREEHFSSTRINWQPKPENLIEIARELDLGVDSLVFVDDNPNERERVRQLLPQVLVPQLPSDPALYRRTLEALPELQRLEATAEDQQRLALYREKRARERARESVGSVADYLASLAIELEIAPATDSTLPRVHQLFQRTNQFNTTTRRYDAGALAKLASDPVARLYTLRARDRFGNHGLVAVALVRADPGGVDRAWRIDSFLMSCRVIGYGIETALLAVVGEDALAAGAERLYGEYSPTAKNAPVADLYARHGFKEAGTEGEVLLFERGLLEDPISRPEWLTMEVRREA